MRTDKIESRAIPLAYWAGATSLLMAVLLLTIHWRLSVMMMAIYGLWCALAPFIPRLGFFVPVISRGCSGRQLVALTFDDGPDPVATPALLGLLKRRGVSVTFFLSGCKVTRYAHLVESIIQHGHCIGNHSYHHDPLVFFKGAAAVRNEIEATQQVLRKFGIVPRVYRPPVGIVGPGLRKPLREFGLRAVNFSCRAFDRGNKRIEGLAERVLAGVRADDIILLHDIMPKGETFCRMWLTEVDKLLNGLVTKGLSVVPLEDLIVKPVTDRIDSRK